MRWEGFSSEHAFTDFQTGKGGERFGADFQVKNVAPSSSARAMRVAIETITQRARSGHTPVAVVNMPTKTKRGKDAVRLMAALPLEELAELLAYKHQLECVTDIP